MNSGMMQKPPADHRGVVMMIRCSERHFSGLLFPRERASMVGMDESPKHQYAGITLNELRSFDVAGLRSTYRELFGTKTHSRNRECP